MSSSNLEFILKLRINRSSVIYFPFDLLYLVSEDQKALLPRLFPWSLCLTITGDLKEQINDLDIHIDETRNHQTSPKHIMYDVLVADNKLNKILSWEQYAFIIIPILPLTLQGLRKPKKIGCEKNLYTPYLMAPCHSNIPYSVRKYFDEYPNPNFIEKPNIINILDDSTVLFTPEGPIRPVCCRCSRMLLHLQGLCQLGSAPCFEELILWTPKESTHAEL